MPHNFQPGQIVATSNGRIGGVISAGLRKITVTHGSDGPIVKYWARSGLRHATQAEENEWNGVSGKRPGRPPNPKNVWNRVAQWQRHFKHVEDGGIAISRAALCRNANSLFTELFIEFGLNK